MKCYVCEQKKFIVYSKAETDITLLPSGAPVAPSLINSKIETILCAQCGVLIYCGERSDDPWFTGQIKMLEYDPVLKKLVDKKRHPDRELESLIKSAPPEALLKALELLSKEQEEKK